MSSETRGTLPSHFVWYECHTPDVAVAEAFYGAVLGWNARDAGMPDRRYTLVAIGETPVGGLLEKPASSFSNGDKPGWMGYIGVDSVDRYIKRVESLSGVVHRAAEDIPQVGRFAVVADPQGAIFTLFEPWPVDQPQRLPVGTPGTAAWHDLTTSDGNAAFAFYADLFDWSRSGTVDMGPNGMYQIFAAGSERLGGIMNRVASSPISGWFFTFHVTEIHAAADRVKQQGGQVIHGPSIVPGDRQIAHCRDPLGALFGIVAPSA